MCSGSRCLEFGADHHWGVRRRRCFFSRISRYPWLKGFLLLNSERAFHCLVWPGWDVGISTGFHTLQDLLGRSVRTTTLRVIFDFVEEILHFVI